MTTITAPAAELPFTLGHPRTHRALTLVPLFPTAEPGFEYVGLDEASAAGLVVTEVDQGGDVNLLRFVNPLDTHVLLYEGEEVAGAKQNRIVQATALLAPASQNRVPVDCVERGRWAYRSQNLEPAPHTAYPELRRERHRGGDQRAVWANVAAKSARLGAESPTDAQDEMFLRHASTVDEFLAALPRLAGQSGVVVGIGGRVACLDYVGRPEVFAGLYAKLLRGYALDAIEAKLERATGPRQVERFVGSIDRRNLRMETPVGIGFDGRYRGPIVGQELSAFGELVALSAYPA